MIDRNTKHFHPIVWNSYDLLRRIQICLPSKRKLYNDNDKYEPVFIVGSGRSGNTLLRRIINASNEIYIPPELEMLGHIISIYHRYSNMPWNELVNLICSSIEYHKEFDTLGIDSLRELVNKLQAVNKGKQTLAFILNSFYQFLMDKHEISAKRWGDKTPLNSFQVFRIKQVFPDGKFVHIIRNGYDVISSYNKSNLLDLDTAAFRWKEANRYLRKFGKKHPRNYHLVRYEDLVSLPEETIRNICEFINIQFDPRLLELGGLDKHLGDIEKYDHHKNVYKPISKDSIGKGIKNLTDDEIKRINSVIADDLVKYNYDVAGLTQG